jgi:hypothetical protein
MSGETIVSLSVTVKPPALRTLLANSSGDLGAILRDGYRRGRAGADSDISAAALLMRTRRTYGFELRYAPILTQPDGNEKLAKGARPSYGVTLAHADISGFELCPWRGHCARVCVVSNGNGAYPATTRAWRWRTELLAKHPGAFVHLLGWELGRAVRRHGEIWFRPDVNSDLAWHTWLPELGTLPLVRVYGYSKNPALLVNAAPAGFVYAFSRSENSSAEKVAAYLASGGRVAVVTDRRAGDRVNAQAVREALGVADTVRVVDADVTDGWMLSKGSRGIVGDLSAKGRARSLIGRSGFVLECYGVR